MKKVYYENGGFYPKQNSEGTRIEVSMEYRNSLAAEINKLSHESGGKAKIEYQIDNETGLPVVVERKATTEEIQNRIRRQRKQVFGVVNRGEVWYNTLSPQQKEQLQEWYQRWLDAPETLETPSWLSWLK